MSDKSIVGESTVEKTSWIDKDQCRADEGHGCFEVEKVVLVDWRDVSY